MKTLAVMIMIAGMLSGGAAYAAKSCTDQPNEKWMSVKAFREKAEAAGYKIRKIKQPGTCYEIYGTDKDGSEVEIYFNPVDGSIAKRK